MLNKKNFLNKEDHELIHKVLISNHFPWYYNSFQTPNDINSYFYHNFYTENNVNSNFYNILLPIINKIKPISIINIRANLLVNTGSSKTSSFHNDGYNNPKLNHNTLIYYVNTNNGYTEFENKTKINSIANSAALFKADKKHRACSQTDTDYRLVINFNYF